MDGSQNSAQATRELVFCHECEEEWHHNQHGLVCPRCRSEFTEIIEDSRDPRADTLHDPSDEEPDFSSFGRSVPRQEREVNDSRPEHPLHGHNPWNAHAPDPDEDDINRFHFHRNGPGSFTVTGTFVRNMPPRVGNTSNTRDPNGSQPGGVAQNFMSMLHGILGNNAGLDFPHPGIRQTQQRQDDALPPHGESQRQGTETQNADTGARPSPAGNGPRFSFAGGGPAHRFHYSTHARVFPRDANHPQPRMEPVDELHGMLHSIFGPEGALRPGPVPHGPRFGSPHRAENPFGDNPLVGILAQLLGPPGAQGDYVFSQEQLDRVVSGLMEQNASGGAPGPASQEAIEALAKRTVDEKMLGSEGRAECSICMDEVSIGEEVTELPCGHWFHGQCVTAWLSEHDTCPHCRKGISDGTRRSAPMRGAPGVATTQTDAPSGPSTPPRNMPGSFDAGSPPFLSRNFSSRMDERPGASRNSSNQHSGRRQSASSTRSDHNAANEGIASRIRRGLFGGTSRRPSSGAGS